MSMLIAMGQAALDRATGRAVVQRPAKPAARSKVTGPVAPPVVGVPLAWVNAFEAGMVRYGWAPTSHDDDHATRAFHDPDHVLAATCLAVIAEMVASGQVDPAQLAAIAPPTVHVTHELPAPSRRALEGGEP